VSSSPTDWTASHTGLSPSLPNSHYHNRRAGPFNITSSRSYVVGVSRHRTSDDRSSRAVSYMLPPARVSILFHLSSGSLPQEHARTHTHNKQLELISVAAATLAHRRRRSVRTCLPNEDPSPKADCTSLLAIDRAGWRRKVIACK
jgi:hypothetical protein